MQEHGLHGKALIIAFLITFHPASQSLAQIKDDFPRDSVSHTHTWQYVGAGGAIILTTILLHYDQPIYDKLYAWKMNNRAIQTTSPIITDLGDGKFSMGLFSGFVGYGLIWKDEKACEVGKIGLESFLLSGITVQLFKHLCGRERPSAATRDGGFWNGPFSYFRAKNKGRSITSFDAFPSGHTATVFAAATALSDYYPDPWVSYTCYSLASLTAISRVMESTHWLSDCFIGGIIGYYSTKLIERWNSGSETVSLQPQIDQYHYGVLLCIKF